MRDQISIGRVALLHPKVRDEAIRIIEEAESKFPSNMAIRVAQGYRTYAEQDALYAQGRTKPGDIVTKARGGQSYHNFRLAIDFAILHDKEGDGKYEELSWDTLLDWDKDKIPDWIEVESTFEVHGWEWGGKWRTFKDLPHVQKTFGYSESQLDSMYRSKNFIPGTDYLNI